MRRIKYLIIRILKMNYRQMFETVAKIHKKTGRSRIWLFFDMVNCGLRYGAGYMDYMLCEFYDLTKEQRETYVTRGVNNRIVQLMNDPKSFHFMDDKCEFNEIFAEFVHRGWLNMKKATPEEFEAFMATRDRIITKPIDDSCGRGVDILNKADFDSVQKMYEHLQSIGSGLIEDVIVQHPEVSAIYPHAINTYRIVTIHSEGVSNVVYAYIRFGNGGHVVDNINAGGMTTPIDLETGMLNYPGYDKDSICYDVHPYTGHPIVGTKLPYWHEAVEMCLKASAMIPQLGYVGWDIAVSPDGPQLIEGNPFPGHDFLQLPPHIPDKVGMLPRFRQFVKGL